MSSSQAYSKAKSLRCAKRMAMPPDLSVHGPAPARGFDFRSSYVVMWICHVDTERPIRTKISVLRPLVDIFPFTAHPLSRSSLCSWSSLSSFSSSPCLNTLFQHLCSLAGILNDTLCQGMVTLSPLGPKFAHSSLLGVCLVFRPDSPLLFSLNDD